ncbi:hypothetical protein D3C73_1163370 [compost metagenome]
MWGNRPFFIENYSISRYAEILEAPEDKAMQWGRAPSAHQRTEADRGDPIFPKTLLFQQLRTQEALYRSMEPGIKGKGTNKGISVRCPAE